MLKAILTGESFKRSVITILILSMLLPLVTAFANPESSTLSEIDPYYFDSDMLPQLYDTFEDDNQFIDISEFLMDSNELAEPSKEEIEEMMRTGALGFRAVAKSDFENLLDSGLPYSELTEDNRSFLFTQLNISESASEITEQLFAVMEQDGFSLAQSIELAIILSGGLFDYAEARQLLNHFP